MTATLAAGRVRLVEVDARRSPAWFDDDGRVYVTTDTTVWAVVPAPGSGPTTTEQAGAASAAAPAR